MRIGIFSSFIEQDAFTLVNAICSSVINGEIPNSRATFIFSNRERGESPVTDGILDEVASLGVPNVLAFSYKEFLPEEKKLARKKEREEDDSSSIIAWRNKYGEEVMRRLPQTDIDLLLGDMTIWGENMCEGRTAINLHPALPGGPQGGWYNVVWDLIENNANETGVMMHFVTPVLDQGHPVAFCRFSIRGSRFDHLWEQLPENKGELRELIQEGRSQKEKATNPLFRAIREEGFIREIPLVIQTTKAFAQGAVRVEGGLVIDRNGQVLKEGHDLTGPIDEIIKPKTEGNLPQKGMK
ncbi:MAG: hypothetical protein A3B44_00915 [Candidatus Levybacteria bacterium RIFCSPLOWO2_01_FULL_38_21]|nr:MAG: hypothetical protein A3B44_00915 [Candidatus Levybacteria bacterium RIFCSPLOWO2_01_FULL_38_21]